MLAAAVFVLGGCDRRPPPTVRPESSNTLRTAWRADAATLDPAAADDWFSQAVIWGLFEGLYDYGPDGTLVPGLAESLPQVSPDGRTYTVRLRRGVRFADGRPLRAADVAFTLERLLDPRTRSIGSSLFEEIRGARAFEAARGRGDAVAHVAGLAVVDDRTVRVELDHPDVTLANLLALPLSFVLPAERVKLEGDAFFEHPVGTGPFVLQEWRRGARIRLARNPLYRLPGTPALDGVDISLGGDETTQLMMFERGELDLLLDVPAADFPRIRADLQRRQWLVSQTALMTIYLSLNTELPPFADVRIRQAVAAAIDRDRVLRVLNQRAVAATGMLPPGIPGFDPHAVGQHYDPAHARRLLVDAGHPGGGVSFPLCVSGDRPEYVKVAETIQPDLAAVGFAVDLRVMSQGALSQAVSRRRQVVASIGGYYQEFPDPGAMLDLTCSGDRITDVGCLNRAFYANPLVDRALRSAAVEGDRDRRLDLYRQAERQVVADAPYVFLYHRIDYRLLHPWVSGFTPNPSWWVRFGRLGLTSGSPRSQSKEVTWPAASSPASPGQR